jgi:HlyD family secretion protein
MNKTLTWILIIVGLLAVLYVGAKVIKGSGNKGIKVTTEKAQRKTIIETVTASGKIYPEIEVKISPDISGEITELDVQEGDSVRKGQILARIYADIYSSQRDEAAARVAQSQATVANSEASLDALQAQLDQAKTNYDRNKQLFDEKVISKAEFEQYETQYHTAQAQYNAAKQNIRSLQAGTQSTRTTLVAANKNLSRTVLTAPMDGVISSLTVKKGERVAGNSFSLGTEMMRVANMNTMEVQVDVGENDIVKVNLNDSADVQVEAYNNRKFKGVVTQIAKSTKSSGSLSSATSGDVTNYEVHIRIDPSSYADLIDPSKPRKFPFLSGMNASADIKTKRKDNVVAVPIASVGTRVKGSDKSVEEQKKEKEQGKDPDAQETTTVSASDELEEVVFVLKQDGTVEKRTVTTGIQDVNNFEVTTGLKEGEQVITAPFEAVNKTLKNGDKVVVVTREKLFK